MKKLFVFFSILLLFQCTAQKSTTISSTGTTTLKGIGSLGGNTDKISVRRYNNTLITPYLYGAYFKAISDKKAGVGISIRNDSTSLTDGKLQAAHILLRNDSLIIYKRSTYNQPLSKIYGKANVSIPIFLTAEANGNKLKVYTSKKSDGTNLTKVLDKDSVFLGWKHKTPNLLFPISKQIASVDITGISIKTAITDTTGSNSSSNNSGGNGNSGGGGNQNQSDGTVYTSISNIVKHIPLQIDINQIPLDLVGTYTIPTYTNAQGYIRPNWGVWMNFFGKPFRDYGIKPWEVGIMGSSNVDTTDSKGWGRRYIDYIMDSDVGYNGITYNNFTSAIPSQHRHIEYPMPQSDRLQDKGLEGSYDYGNEIIMGPLYGIQDNIYNKTQRGSIDVDVETNEENGSQYHVALLEGMASNTTADVSSLYGTIIPSLGNINSVDTQQKVMKFYPNSQGNYGSDFYISQDWAESTPGITISSRGITNKKLIDFPNIIPSTEVAFYSIDWNKQGQSYDLGNGNSIITNKYGTYATGKNTEHYLSRAGTLAEWQAYFVRYKLDNRRNKLMIKLIADRGNYGRADYIPLGNGNFASDIPSEHTFKTCNRRQAFHLVAIAYMNNLDLKIWDKNTMNTGAMDNYIGAFAAIKMFQTSGGADAYNDMIPQYWNTKQAYSDTTTWVSHKAIDWQDSPNIAPCRTKVSKPNTPKRLEAFCWRVDGLGPTDIWLKATVGGEEKKIHITTTSWETTNSSLKDLPKTSWTDQNRDYFYTIINYN